MVIHAGAVTLFPQHLHHGGEAGIAAECHERAMETLVRLRPPDHVFLPDREIHLVERRFDGGDHLVIEVGPRQAIAVNSSDVSTS